MNSTPPTDANAVEDRNRAILSLIDELRANRSVGSVSDEAILQAHPGLMPELGNELRKLRRIEAARAAAAKAISPDASPESADANLLIAQALVAEMERLPIEVPGYAVLREIGRGGQAAVYQAVQLSTGQPIALKIMRAGPFADERSLARFKREVQILAALNHPNIVIIIDTGKTEDGSHFIAMRYIPGLGLAEYMHRAHKTAPCDPSSLLLLFHKICDAVNAAHLQGIVHRDLKPGNIRVDERGEPHILDFGLARTTLDFSSAAGHDSISITGEFLGSLPWSSPEQAEGDPEKIDSRTDVYSLGVILYQMLTGGRFPYEVVGNIRNVLNNILTCEPTPPSKMIAAGLARQAHGDRREAMIHSPRVNESIERIVLKALSKQPAARYATAGEMGKEIAAYLAGHPTTAPAPSTAPPRLPWHGRLARVFKQVAQASRLWRDPNGITGETPVPRNHPRNRSSRRGRHVLYILTAAFLTYSGYFIWRHFVPHEMSYVTIPGLELSPADPLPAPPAGQQWELAWNDEFDGDALDASRWTAGPGTGESADSGAVSLDGSGHLVLSTARIGGNTVMGQVSTAGKFEHGYGYYVCRVLFQEEQDLSTAFRLEGNGGRVGVFEKQGSGNEIDHAVTLTNPFPRDEHKTVSLPGLSQGWHTLAVWWTPQEYIFFIDGRESWRTSAGDASQGPQAMTLGGLINAAVNSAERRVSDCFLVDYVRIYDLTKNP